MFVKAAATERVNKDEEREKERPPPTSDNLQLTFEHLLLKLNSAKLALTNIAIRPLVCFEVLKPH